jgi:hypothetical protein
MSSVFGPEYVKIHSAFMRDMSKRAAPVIPGKWARPEFEYLKHVPWRWTEKIDGTNTRLHWNGIDVQLGGRTDNAQIPAHLVNAIRELGLLDTEKWTENWTVNVGESLTEYPDVTLYGEGYGPKIQKGGGLYRDDVGFILFDVRVGRWWLEPAAVRTVAEHFGLDTVPYYGEFSPVDAWDLICDDGLVSDWYERGVQIEGIVGTPLVPLFARDGSRVIMKLKVKDWEDLKRSQAQQ